MSPIIPIDPYVVFDEWFQKAVETEPNDPNAMALATSNSQGFPSIRMVLMKGHDKNGFIFYTNFNSRKGRDLAENPNAALLFHWKTQERQIRIEGKVERLPRDKSELYFHTRPPESQLAAWASAQSEPLESREKLLERVNFYKEKFKNTQPIPKPDHWGGFLLRPARFEFWQDGAYRLHDRFEYQVDSEGGWRSQWLNP